MTEPGPASATPIEAGPTAVLPWDLVRDVVKDARTYWFATVHPWPSARPRVASRLGRRSPLQHLNRTGPQGTEPRRQPTLHGDRQHRQHGRTASWKEQRRK